MTIRRESAFTAAVVTVAVVAATCGLASAALPPSCTGVILSTSTGRSGADAVITAYNPRTDNHTVLFSMSNTSRMSPGVMVLSGSRAVVQLNPQPYYGNGEVRVYDVGTHRQVYHTVPVTQLSCVDFGVPDTTAATFYCMYQSHSVNVAKVNALTGTIHSMGTYGEYNVLSNNQALFTSGVFYVQLATQQVPVGRLLGFDVTKSAVTSNVAVPMFSSQLAADPLTSDVYTMTFNGSMGALQRINPATGDLTAVTPHPFPVNWSQTAGGASISGYDRCPVVWSTMMEEVNGKLVDVLVGVNLYNGALVWNAPMARQFGYSIAYYHG